MRLKTGEKLYERPYLSPRPPPKISLRRDHDWTRGNDKLGSTVEQQPVSKIVRQSCGEVQRTAFSQLTQPRPKPICDRSGKLGSTEDVFVVKGDLSRFHEIDEKRLHEELGSSDRSGKPDKLSENTRVEQTHDGEQNSSSAHTQWTNNLPLKKIVTLRYSTRTTSSTVQSTRRTSTSIFQDYHILQWNNHMAPTFKVWFRRSRTTLIDKHFKAIFNNVNNSILSAQNQKTWFVKLRTSNYPKAQCKICLSYWDVGIVYCTCGHFLQDGKEENKQFIKYTLDLLSIPNYYIKKGRPTGTVTGRIQGTTSTTSRIRSRRSAKRETSWVSTTGSSETRSSVRTCLTSVALKQCVVRWTNWRTKTTRTTSLQKKFVCTETIGGVRDLCMYSHWTCESNMFSVWSREWEFCALFGSILVLGTSASFVSSSSSFPISTSSLCASFGSMASLIGARSVFRIFAGLASALLC